MKHYMKDGSEVLRFMRVTALMAAVVGVVALLVAIPSSAGPGEPIQRASALLRPIEGSGIRGNVVIRDNGSKLTVSGTAWGLDPNAPGGYISLFYDILSVATGEEPCVRGLSDGDPLGISGRERGGGGTPSAYLGRFPQWGWEPKRNSRSRSRQSQDDIDSVV